MVDRYMVVLNNAVSKLNEVNVKTIKTINIESEMKKIQPMMKEDSKKIEKLAGENITKFIATFFHHNILPFLQNYYKGPGIYFNDVVPIPGITPQIITLNYPNKVLIIRPKCEPGYVVKVEKGVRTCVASWEINRPVSSPQTPTASTAPTAPSTISVTSPTVATSPFMASSSPASPSPASPSLSPSSSSSTPSFYKSSI
jgi:hypothetical protein